MEFVLAASGLASLWTCTVVALSVQYSDTVCGPEPWSAVFVELLFSTVLVVAAHQFPDMARWLALAAICMGLVCGWFVARLAWTVFPECAASVGPSLFGAGASHVVFYLVFVTWVAATRRPQAPEGHV